MKTNKIPKTYAHALVENLLKRNKMRISIVEDMEDHNFKFAIVFNTAHKTTGIDDMTEDKIKDLLFSIMDERLK